MTWLLSGLLLLGWASATPLSELETKLEAALPNDRAGVAIAYLDAEGTNFAFLGNPVIASDSLFEYASITKVFTAILLADLSAEGVVSLESRVNDGLPPRLRAEMWQNVTLFDLATHSAGLPSMPPNMGFFYALLHPNDFYAAYTEDLLWDGVRETELEPVGEFNSYSNYGFGLLGVLLSRAAGTPYPELIETRLFDPLGMRGARLGAWSSHKIAPPLDAAGDAAVREASRGALAAAGDATGSVRDAARFVRMSMEACRRSDALSQANCRAQQATGVRVSEREAQGLGWIRSTSAKGDILWHNGGASGYTSFLGFNVETERGLVVLINVADVYNEVTGESLRYLASP